METIRADFDKLAVLEETKGGWSHNDHYLKVSATRRICQDTLPGSIIRKHLFWRYSLVWYKPVV